jgi:hypothetical protein
MACFCCGQRMGVMPVSAGCSGCDAVQYTVVTCSVVWCMQLCPLARWGGVDHARFLRYEGSVDLPEKTGTWGYKVRMAGLREPLPTFRATWLGYNYQRNIVSWYWCTSGLTAYFVPPAHDMVMTRPRTGDAVHLGSHLSLRAIIRVPCIGGPGSGGLPSKPKPGSCRPITPAQTLDLDAAGKADAGEHDERYPTRGFLPRLVGST